MEYGILVAEQEDPSAYQIIGTVDSVSEAKEVAGNYFINGPECGSLPPERFVIIRRGYGGWYTKREIVEL